MSLLNISLLGRPEMRWQDRLLKFRTHKALALLAYLVVEDGPHPREALATLFWPESDPAQRRMMLRTTLQHVRQALPADADLAHILRAEHDAISLPRDPNVWLDLDGLSRAARAIRETAPTHRQTLLPELQATAALCRGAFMHGFTLHDAPDFDHWVQTQQQRWRQSADAVFDQLAQIQFAAGDVPAALETAQRWLAFDRFSDAAQRRVIELLSIAGDRAGALHAFEMHAAALARELDAQPSPEMLSLVERIRHEAVERPDRAAKSSAIPVTVKSDSTEQTFFMPLIGREDEFARLIALAHEARSGRPQAVVIEGEAGIGKTRLARALIQHALAEGLDVCEACAYETGGRTPYQVVLDALRRRVERENAPDDLMSDVWLAELSGLLPELRDRYPDLPHPLAVSETEARSRRFEAVARFIQAAAARSPLLLFVDDMQWADSASLDLIHYLARHCFEHGSRVLLLMTARMEDGPALTLDQWLAGLTRVLPTARLLLSALTLSHTQQWVQALAGHALSPAPASLVPSIRALGQWLYEETDGQPFFIAETVRAMRERGLIGPAQGLAQASNPDVLDVAAAAQLLHSQPAAREMMGIPPGVRELIHARTGRLGTGASGLFLAASVIGQPAHFEALRAVAALDEPEALRALDELLDTHLLHETESASGTRRDVRRDTRYVVSHDKIREVTYTSANDARQRVFHRRALETLRDIEDTPAATLAYHALQVRLHDEAARWSIAAGDQALSVFAVPRAIEHYERARSLLGGALERQDAEAVLRLGRAYELAGTSDQAGQAYEQLLAHARATRNAVLETSALSRMATLASQAHNIPRADELAAQMLSSAQASGALRVQAQAEWALAQSNFYFVRYDVAIHYAERALTLAKQTDDADLIARCFNVLAYIYNALYQPQRALAAAAAAREQYAALRNTAMEGDTLALCATAYIRCGQPQAAVEVARTSLQSAEGMEHPWGMANGGAKLAVALLEAGDLGAAVRVAEQAWQIAKTHQLGLMIAGSQVTLALLYRALFRLDEARHLIEDVRAKSAIEPLTARTAAELCAVCALAGDWGMAGDYAREVALARVVHPLASERAVWLETEALLRVGETALAERHVQGVGGRAAHSPLMRIHHLRAQAVLMRWRNQAAQATEHLHEALRLAEDLALPNERWQICAALGEQARASEIIQSLAERIGETDIRQHFVERAERYAVEARFLPHQSLDLRDRH